MAPCEAPGPLAAVGYVLIEPAAGSSTQVSKLQVQDLGQLRYNPAMPAQDTYILHMESI
jgi:hypothetical protein